MLYNVSYRIVQNTHDAQDIVQDSLIKAFKNISKLDEEAHLNTSFKHFYYFVNEYSLVDKREMMPLGPLIERIIRRDQERYGKRIVKL